MEVKMNEDKFQLTNEDYDSSFQSTSEQLDKAVDDCRKRMNNLTAEEREELYEKGLATVFPNGRYLCSNGHIGVWVAKGSECRMCKK
jgi:hypothetical protein